MTLDDVRALALSLGGTLERPSYGTPAFFVGKKIYARMLPGGRSVVVRVDLDVRVGLVEAYPDIFSVTDHYRGYPLVIVSLETVAREMLAGLLEEAWRLAGAGTR